MVAKMTFTYKFQVQGCITFQVSQGIVHQVFYILRNPHLYRIYIHLGRQAAKLSKAKFHSQPQRILFLPPHTRDVSQQAKDEWN